MSYHQLVSDCIILVAAEPLTHSLQLMDIDSGRYTFDVTYPNSHPTKPRTLLAYSIFDVIVTSYFTQPNAHALGTGRNDLIRNTEHQNKFVMYIWADYPLYKLHPVNVHPSMTLYTLARTVRDTLQGMRMELYLKSNNCNEILSEVSVIYVRASQ